MTVLDMDDDDLDFDTNFNAEDTEYFSFNRWRNLLKNKRENDITAIHVNIRSLPARMVELNNTLASLDFNPDIIGLSETKLTTKTNSHYNPSIQNYNFFQSQSCTFSGSVGVFIKNSFVVKIRNDLDITVPGMFETVWFDLEHKNKKEKSTFAVLYRHPGFTDIPFFQRKLETSLEKINRTKNNFYNRAILTSIALS